MSVVGYNWLVHRLCHINMLKAYQQRSEEITNEANDPVTSSQVLCSTVLKERDSSSKDTESVVGRSPKLRNSDILKKFQTEKLNHLDPTKQGEMMQLVFQFVSGYS